jgi:putative redox protein
VISRTVTLKGDLSEENRQRLLQIADRCPVHRTLHGELEIQTQLA